MQEKHERIKSDAFLAVRNRIKINSQYNELSDIIDRAGKKLVEIDVHTGEADLEIKSVICSATFMMSSLAYLLTEATRSELETKEISEVIMRAEAMTRVMNSAFH